MSETIQLSDLIERYNRNAEAYRSSQYNETQLRREFLDPFFDALGWDVENKNGYAEAYKDVVHEDAIKIGGFTKAPDYSFRIGGTRKFFVEAKKPSIRIKDDPDPAFQLRRYAWSAKLPLSILTNFEEFSVYDCRIKPDKTDKAAIGRILYFTCAEYEKHWTEIVSIFSREAVLKGSFDKYAESSKTKKGTAEVDAAFLKEIESWREMLARILALRNPDLSQRNLNFAVQTTIDRIIFLRICEDRGIEDYGRLFSLQNGTNAYERLCQLFRHADERYNSGLFHLRAEKMRPEPPDDLTLNLLIDDKVIKEIIKNLYYPDSPYEFSVLSADILGQVYEQFLGKVIHLTAGHRAVIEDKPEVKKAGGVYYTPRYIVDYIVKNTVGKLLEGKTPKQAANIKILDPACGSGSFLIGAYQSLLDWHRDWYSSHTPGKWAKGKSLALYQASGGGWRLTTGERKRILLNSIFGVDIDTQAVEVTKLSLLLKVLEGETEQSISQQMTLFHERALPDLSNNIKCGNSLIGPDFYDNRQMGLFDDTERYRINVFDWNAEFSDIMEAGGFDAVIGNPPYVRQEMLGDLKQYFQKHYSVYDGSADLYAYFIEKGVSLLKDGGIFSYIVANKWMRASYGEPLRTWLKGQCIEEIVDFGDLPVFEKATTYPCIIRISNTVPKLSFNAVQVKTLDFGSLKDYVSSNSYNIDQTTLDDKGWSLSDNRTQLLLSKILKQGVPLGEYVKGKIYRGVLTGLNEAFVIDSQTREQLIAEDPKSAELIKPFLLGRDVKRYQPPASNRFLIFTRRGINIKNYPAIYHHLLQFKERLMPKPRDWKGESWKGRKPGSYQWYEVQDAIDYWEEFEKAKIIIPSIIKNASYTFDASGFYSNDKTSIIASDDMYLLGVLNSRVSDFFIHSISSTKQGGYFEYKPMYVQQTPIRTIDFSNLADVVLHSRMVSLVEQMLGLHKQFAEAKTPHDKTAIQRQIDAIDRQIDLLVYELYGLTEEEIAIVEHP
ncbi:MAG: Eco57I restriction-modification methylase domain-containing protein [Proteobacteria bacterium]|nr:Eco57I restriction-modification methylase domain-containing protein [Pseudomonadota bacterium]